jgi:RNA polymerase sigma-70 factor (ECF subfamily)
METLETHLPIVVAYVRRKLAPNAEAANDIVQDTFLAAWQNRAVYRADSPLRSWLLGIARHKVQDHFRRSRRAPQSIEDLCPAQEPSSPLRLDAALALRQECELVRGAVAGLPQNYKQVVRERYWAGCNACETGARMGKTAKSVERMLSRSRDQLRERLIRTCAARSGSWR